MQVEKIELTGDITLEPISEILRNVNISNIVEKSSNSTEMTFDIYTLAPDAPIQIGNVILKSEFMEDDTSLLTCHSRQNMLDGHIYEVQAQIYYNNSTPIYVPKKWTYTTNMKNSSGESLKYACLKKSGAFDRGIVTINNDKTSRKHSIKDACTINWLLFEAVRHLPKDTQIKHEFTMFDHFDQVKKEQLLYYSKSVQTNIKGMNVVLHAFDHLGDGIVPWVYWVDEYGRLLFVVSGIEAYVLNF